MIYSYEASDEEMALIELKAAEVGISAAVYFSQMVFSSLAQVKVTHKAVLEQSVIAEALDAVSKGQEYTVKLVDGYISGSGKVK